MDNSKKGNAPMIEKPDYSKSQGDKTPSEVQRMQRVPYASAIGVKPKAELKVSYYADASFQTDKDDTKSQTGNMCSYLMVESWTGRVPSKALLLCILQKPSAILLLKHRWKLSG
ncbi:hypothetical protein Tco_0364712 [Tanacetum coccineum]